MVKVKRERPIFTLPDPKPNLIDQELPDIDIGLGNDEEEYEYEISINEIEMSPDQTRKIDINSPDIIDLATNIEKLGLFYPIIVRPHPNLSSQFKWQMIAGERRVTAFQKLGREFIPAKIRTKLAKDDQVAWAVTLSENTLRKQLKPNEAANAIDDGREKFGLSRDEIAAAMGLAPETISRLHGINKLPEDLIVELEKHNKLKRRHIAAFRLLIGQFKLASINLEDSDTGQIAKIKENVNNLLKTILNDNLNGDEAIEQAKDILNPGKVKTVLTSLNMRVPDLIRRRPKNMSTEKRTLFINQGERIIKILQAAINEERLILQEQQERDNQNKED